MNFPSLIERLTQDIAPIGALQAPLLSWLGSAGLLTFFSWHIVQLYRHTAEIQQPFQRICRTLGPLVQAREHHTSTRSPHDRRNMTRTSANEPDMNFNSRDAQDLQLVDHAFHQEPLLAQAWNRYRHTLVTEQVPWYVEPRIFSSRPAQEFFALDTVLRHRISLTWHNQVPSLLTGIGLLFTFMALLIGLSKLHLHADGRTIIGIQGLINGLAGKFLTSIVGLLCANLFALLEKPAMFRLSAAHQTCLQHLDELFPRKTLEQLLEGLSGTVRNGPQAQRFTPYVTQNSAATDPLVQPTKTMTEAVHTLTQELRTHLAAMSSWQEAHSAQVLSDTLAQPIQRLTGTIERLIDRLNTQQQQHDASAHHVNRLIDQLTGRLNQGGGHLDVPPPTPLSGGFSKLHHTDRGLHR